MDGDSMSLDNLIFQGGIAATVVGPVILGATRGYAMSKGIAPKLEQVLAYAPTLVPAVTLGIFGALLDRATAGYVRDFTSIAGFAGVGAIWGYSTGALGYAIGSVVGHYT